MTLANSKELERMFIGESAELKGKFNEVSIRFGVIGAGQKGNKDADILAGYTFSNGEQCYPSLAINLSESDMTHLKNIPQVDRIHFEGMKGAARTPQVVVDMFDPQHQNGQAHQERLTGEIGRKFYDENGNPLIDQFLICLGAGGGVGTGWGSLVLNLIRNDYFAGVPVTLLISLPHGNPEEITNALVLLKELEDFFKEQETQYESNETKPLASVILVDNKRLYESFNERKDQHANKGKVINWKEESNNAILSTLHEVNLIPQNFGSDSVTYDPSDLIKLFSVPGRFLTLGKARLQPEDFTLNGLSSKVEGSLNRGYFACDHKFGTATMYGGFVLRPHDSEFFADMKTEEKLKDTLSKYKRLDEIGGKFGDPIWNQNYSVVYSIFAGMRIPNRYVQLANELNELVEKQQREQQEEEEVDVSIALNRIQNNSFNPYANTTGSRFNGPKQSAFTKQVAATVEKKGFGSNAFGSFGNKTSNTEQQSSGNKFGQQKTFNLSQHFVSKDNQNK
ncbi:cell division protein FtsZ [Bacillus salitolerans]|uniref:Cell division protein FtsZ n=1 Tax=Bacillus salitolerans TaxID=1437434 RepID=A0ABW4LMV4_9BACI